MTTVRNTATWKDTATLEDALSSSHKAHPWPETLPAPTPAAWARPWKTHFAQAGHFTPESSKIGATAKLPNPYAYSMYSQACPSMRTHYMEVPLQEIPSTASFITTAPVTSKSFPKEGSNMQQTVMDNANASYADALAAATANTALRTTYSPSTPMPNLYATSTGVEVPRHPAATADQHRIRTFTTSKLLTDLPDRLESAPMRCEAALAPKSTLLTTRFHSLRDSDGTRRILDCCAPDMKAPPYPHQPYPIADPLLRLPATGKFIPFDPISEMKDKYLGKQSGL